MLKLEEILKAHEAKVSKSKRKCTCKNCERKCVSSCEKCLIPQTRKHKERICCITFPM